MPRMKCCHRKGSGKQEGLGSCLQENIMKNGVLALNPVISKPEDDSLSAIRRYHNPHRRKNQPFLDKGGGAFPVEM